VHWDHKGLNPMLINQSINQYLSGRKFDDVLCRGIYKMSEFWPRIWFCSIAAHQELCLQQFMAKNMMTFGALKLKCTCGGKRLQDTGNVAKSVTAMLMVTQLPFRPFM